MPIPSLSGLSHMVDSVLTVRSFWSKVRHMDRQEVVFTVAQSTVAACSREDEQDGEGERERK